MSAALSGLLLGGCAAVPTTAALSPTLLPHPSETGIEACFFRRLVVSFQVLDHSNLLVFAPSPEDAYHLRIEPVASLAEQDLIAFASRSHQICGVPGDTVFFEDRPDAVRYRILAVSLVDGETALDLLERAGTVPATRPPAE